MGIKPAAMGMYVWTGGRLNRQISAWQFQIHRSNFFSEPSFSENKMSKVVGTIDDASTFHDFTVEWNSGLWDELKEMKKGQEVVSPPFKFRGKQWELALFPNGRSISSGSTVW